MAVGRSSAGAAVGVAEEDLLDLAENHSYDRFTTTSDYRDRVDDEGNSSILIATNCDLVRF